MAAPAIGIRQNPCFLVQRQSSFPFTSMVENDFNVLTFNELIYNVGFDIDLGSINNLFIAPSTGLYQFHGWLNPGGTIGAGGQQYMAIRINGALEIFKQGAVLEGQCTLDGIIYIVENSTIELLYAPISSNQITSIKHRFAISKVG